MAIPWRNIRTLTAREIVHALNRPSTAMASLSEAKEEATNDTVIPMEEG